MSDGENRYEPVWDDVGSPEPGAVEYEAAEPEGVSRTLADRVVRNVAGTDEHVTLTELRFRSLVDEDGDGNRASDAFERGANAWQSVSDHEHIVSLVDWAVEDGQGMLLTEQMDGGNLRTRLTADEIIWADEAVWIVECLCRAVEHAHEADMCHLAIDPSAVQFRDTDAPSWDLPKLGGWVTKHARDDPAGVSRSDVTYAAPEQLDPNRFGDPDERTDVYRLGCILYRLLAGQPPLVGTGYDILRGKVSGSGDGDGEPIVPPSAVTAAAPDVLDDIVLTALEADPADRYQSVARFRAALADIELPPAVETAATDGEYRQYAGGPANRWLARARIRERTRTRTRTPTESQSRPDDHDVGVGVGVDKRESIPDDWQWQTQIQNAVDSQPAIAYGTLYVGDDEGTLTALQFDTGDVRWEVTPDEYDDDTEASIGRGSGSVYSIQTPPAVGQNTVCIATDAGLFAVAAKDGSLLWRRSIDVAGCLTIADETLYVPATGSEAQDAFDTSESDKRLYALDIRSGDTRWVTEMSDGFPAGEPAAPAVTAEVAAVNTDTGVQALDTDTGEKLWEFTARFLRPPSIAAGQVYVGDDDTVYALDAESGHKEWQADIEYEIGGPPAVDDDTVYVTVLDDWGGVHAFDPASGAVRWTYDLAELEDERVPITNAIVTSDTVIVLLGTTLYSNSETEEITALTLDDGQELWRHDVGEKDHSQPAVADHRIALGNSESEVTAVAIPDSSDSASTSTSTIASESEIESTSDEPPADVDVDVDVDADGVRAGADDATADGRTDAEILCSVLQAEPDNELNKGWIPDRTGWSREKTENVLDELQTRDIVEIDDTDDVILLEEPQTDPHSEKTTENVPSDGGRDSDGVVVTDDDRETLLALIEAEPDDMLVRDLIEVETGWTTEKTDAVIEDLKTAGKVAIKEIGEGTFVTIDETGVVGGIDIEAGRPRPDAATLAAHMDNPELAGALEAVVQNAKPNGEVEVLDAMGDLPTTDHWALLIANGYLVQVGNTHKVSLPHGIDFEFSG